MPLVLNELLTEEDFQENFTNTEMLKKTFVLFSFKKENNSLWDIRGYGYNNPGNEHAEVLVLSYIEECIPENQSKVKYQLTLYLSYSPCRDCSARIISFLAPRNGICMKIKASRPYYFSNEEERKGLCHLKRAGVSIKMMDEFDYKECFRLFVHPSKKFTSWHGLDNQSKKNADDLNTVWEQEKEKETDENVRKRIKISNSHSISEVSKPDILLDGHPQSPEMERAQLPGPETPQKLNSSASRVEVGPGVKRKLDFSKN